MNWTEPLNNYCERLDASFWSEPVNAITNASFILAALVAFLMWRKRAPDDWLALALILITLATGIGSFLFHTFANRWSLLADVIPIALFIHVYLFAALNRFLGLRWYWAAGITGLFFVASPFAGRLFAPLVGSSAGYLPALAAIFVVAALVWRSNARLAKGLAAAGVVFAASLTFRTLDMPVCDSLALGTHFMWHILNGLVLFLLLRLLLPATGGAGAK
ncbi:ceramidase domain-containing protein [Pannonibacter indicus]|uniref:Ceramidase n=1 Tax=Pannonibacter indicus TaxID=466044 RepID=A0A0K6HW02_9HYPH|nr:ceramidase domain-containing protein [Pannonibacter indicus]CUA94978.1 Ceramidase [Pannonibacter indicus]